MAHIRAGNAISTGLGLGLGLVLAKHMFQAMKPPDRTAEKLIVCLNCRSRNLGQNNYCWQCGQAFHPLPTTQCTKCGAKVPSMIYCGNCGTQLREAKQKEKGSSAARPVFRHSYRRTSSQ